MKKTLRNLVVLGTLGLASVACGGKSNAHTSDPYAGPFVDSLIRSINTPSTDTSGYDKVKPAIVEEDTALVRKTQARRDSIVRSDSINEARIERENFLKDSTWKYGCIPHTRLVYKDEKGQVQSYDNPNIISRAPSYIVFTDSSDKRNEFTRSGSYDFIRGCKQDILGARDDIYWRDRQK